VTSRRTVVPHHIGSGGPINRPITPNNPPINGKSMLLVARKIHATAGVMVNLGVVGAQNTPGAETDSDDD